MEMYQWEEERETREFKEPDGSITTETKYSYRTCMKITCYKYYRSSHCHVMRSSSIYYTFIYKQLSQVWRKCVGMAL